MPIGLNVIKGIAETLVKGADTFVYTKAEKAQDAFNREQLEAQIAIALKEQESEIVSYEVQDRDSARRMTELINQADKATKLTKNIAAYLALLVGFNVFFVTYILIFVDIPAGKESFVTQTVAAMWGAFMLILGFYFGASYVEGKIKPFTSSLEVNKFSNVAA
ncbi:hypothetical protein [Flammeovirga agarivorans]|uniref:Uncharacterized protein n=1 Tax=Flammeovirga agarivorans TaxID=2726742 RepID=A0A7X8SR29_9BACT|nr:hypothetical protein [Flammeovirga agarivorans]NLR94845.1 hypothetical protein [Flammeovirga agarivorans]